MVYKVDWQSNAAQGIPGKDPIYVEDGSVDTSTTLRLTGRGLSGYGEIQQEGWIRFLENFASGQEPINPTVGQIWFKSDTNRLLVWGMNQEWISVSSGMRSGPQFPNNPSIGELFYLNSDDGAEGMYYWDGNQWFKIKTDASTNAELTSISNITSLGALTRAGTATWVTRNIVGVAGETIVTNGDGVAGNPIVGLDVVDVTPGTYNLITVDEKGRVINGQTISVGDVAVSGPAQLIISTSSTFTITDFDSFSTYTISALSGSVSRTNEVITYTAPATPGAFGFIINGRTIPVQIVTAASTLTSIEIRQGSVGGSLGPITINEGTTTVLVAVGVYSDGSRSLLTSGITGWAKTGSYINITSGGGTTNSATITGLPVTSNQSGQIVTLTAGAFTDTMSITVADFTPSTGVTLSQPIDQSASIGGSATFTAVVSSGTGPFTYQWKLNNANISGATGASYTQSAITANMDGNIYSVSVTGSSGSATRNAYLRVTRPIPAPSQTSGAIYGIAYTIRSTSTPRVIMNYGNGITTSGYSISWNKVSGTIPIGLNLNSIQITNSQEIWFNFISISNNITPITTSATFDVTLTPTSGSIWESIAKTYRFTITFDLREYPKITSGNITAVIPNTTATSTTNGNFTFTGPPGTTVKSITNNTPSNGQANRTSGSVSFTTIPYGSDVVMSWQENTNHIGSSSPCLIYIRKKNSGTTVIYGSYYWAVLFDTGIYLSYYENPLGSQYWSSANPTTFPGLTVEQSDAAISIRTTVSPS